MFLTFLVFINKELPTKSKNTVPVRTPTLSWFPIATATKNNHQQHEINTMESTQDNILDEQIGALLDNKDINITPEIREKIANRISEIKNYIPKIGIFGKTGVGKSSLCNALFGAEISEVSDVAACTREPKEFMFKLAAVDSKGLILMDCPGLGETPERDEEYKALYKNLIPELDLILWVLDASERAYGADISAYRELFAGSKDAEKLIFTLNKVDDFKPKNEWNESSNSPGEKQSALILEKEVYVSEQFSIGLDKICSISVEKKYSLDLLIEVIISAVPNEKKYSFVREAVEENVTPKAQAEAKKGFLEAVWDGIKDTASGVGDFYGKHKNTIHSVIGSIFNAWLALKTKKK